MLTAYFDASTRQDGTVCVAGVVFGVDRAKKALRDWNRLWGDTQCHMTELHARKKGSLFEDWTPAQAGQRLEDCIAIITSTCQYCIAVSVSDKDMRVLAPTNADPKSRIFLDGFSNAYPICCHMGMSLLGTLLPDDEQVSHRFESGDKGQGESKRFTKLMMSQPEARQLYRSNSYSILSKSEERLFECADIVAWEWAKHVQRSRDGIGMRPSLAALIGAPVSEKGVTNVASPRFRGWHIEGHTLERAFRRLDEVGIFRDDVT